MMSAAESRRLARVLQKAEGVERIELADALYKAGSEAAAPASVKKRLRELRRVQ